jgi:uracil-DNA glycosylase
LPDSLDALGAEIVACRACERLVAWREQVGREKRKAFRDDHYWARPIPSFGDDPAPILIVGLAPAAHGANRTGRVFTGDRSADFLVAGMHRAGLASQPTSIGADDGLRLIGCRMTAAVRCAPPANKPTPQEQANCRPYLVRELALLQPRVIVALGGLAWQETLRAVDPPRPWPKFGHAVEATIGRATLLGCYHPSQQNTFTGRLTPPMIDDVLGRAVALAKVR